MNIVELLLGRYWSQISLIIIGCGSLIFYFIKRKFDHKAATIQNMDSLFQNNKIIAIQSFYDTYGKIYYWSVEVIIDIKQGSVPIFNEAFFNAKALTWEMKTSIGRLSIYFNSKDFKLFEEVYSECSNMCGRIMNELYKHQESGKNPNIDFDDKEMAAIEDSIKMVGQFVRMHFHN